MSEKNLIEEVMYEIDERVKAATQREGNAIGPEALGDEQIRLMAAGTGVDPDQLMSIAEKQGEVSLYMIAMGMPPKLITTGIFFQAFMAGVRYRDKYPN